MLSLTSAPSFRISPTLVKSSRSQAVRLAVTTTKASKTNEVSTFLNDFHSGTIPKRILQNCRQPSGVAGRVKQSAAVLKFLSILMVALASTMSLVKPKFGRNSGIFWHLWAQMNVSSCSCYPSREPFELMRLLKISKSYSRITRTIIMLYYYVGK